MQLCWKCCKNLKTPSINSLQKKIKADYLMKRQEIDSFLFFLAGTIFMLCHCSVTNGRCLLTVSACICFSLLCTKCIYRLRSSSSVSPKEKPHWLHWGLVWYTREFHLFESVWLSVVYCLEKSLQLYCAAPNAQAVASPTILHHTRLLVNLQTRLIVILKSFSGVPLYLLQRRF